MGTWGLVTAISFAYIGLFLLLGFLIVSVLIYFVIRNRDRGGELHDPQIGVKFALHFLFSIALFITLIGANMIGVDLAKQIFDDTSNPRNQRITPGRKQFNPRTRRITSRPTTFNATMRSGVGLLISGLMLAGLNLYLLFSRTNQRKWPMTMRMFVGARAIVAGVVFSFAFAAAWVVGLQAEETGRSLGISTALATALVWGLGFAIDFAFLKMTTTRSDIPGNDYFCGDCGTDLRQFGETATCPRCEARIGLSTRRALNALHTPT